MRVGSARLGLHPTLIRSRKTTTINHITLARPPTLTHASHRASSSSRTVLSSAITSPCKSRISNVKMLLESRRLLVNRDSRGGRERMSCALVGGCF